MIHGSSRERTERGVRIAEEKGGWLTRYYLAGWHLGVGRCSGGCGTLPTTEMNGVGF